MAEHLIFHDCPTDVKTEIRDHWAHCAHRLERRLKRFPADQRHLRISIRRQGPAFDVHSVLLLPSGALAAEAHADRCQDALDAVTDHLVQEIGKHKEHLRHEHTYKRKRQRDLDLAATAQLLGGRSGGKATSALLEIVRPTLRSLRGHAKHELVLAQIEDRIRPGTLTVSDVLDETLSRAIENANERPPEEPLDRWLIEMLHQTIDSHSGDQIADISIDDVVDKNDPRYEAENGWVIENMPLWGPPEPLTLETVLPATDASDGGMANDAEEQWILAQLGRFPVAQRRALALHAIEGWDYDEIAMLQHRKADEVQADIEAAQKALRERLHTTM